MGKFLNNKLIKHKSLKRIQDDVKYLSKYGILNLLYSGNILPFLIDNKWEATFIDDIDLKILSEFYEWNLELKSEVWKQIEIFESALLSHSLEYISTKHIDIFSDFIVENEININSDVVKQISIKAMSLEIKNIKLNDKNKITIEKNLEIPNKLNDAKTLKNLINTFRNYSFDNLKKFTLSTTKKDKSKFEFERINKKIFYLNDYFKKYKFSQDTLDFLMNGFQHLRNELAHPRDSIYKLRFINESYLRDKILGTNSNSIGNNIDILLNECKARINKNSPNYDEQKLLLCKKIKNDLNKFDCNFINNIDDLFELRIIDAYYVLCRINAESQEQALSRKRKIENIIFDKISSWSISLDAKNKIIDYLNKKCHLKINKFDSH